jgi:hypothetical protein
MAQLPTQSQFGDYSEWPGRDVLDSSGQRLGGVREIYLDRETGRPEWVLVDVDGTDARFVPLADANVAGWSITVAHSAETIKKAPGIGAEPRIDQSEERRLYSHYGLGYSEDDSGSGLPSPDEAPAPTGWGAKDEPSWQARGGDEPSSATADAPAPSSDDEPAPFTAPTEPSNLAPPPAEPPSAAEIDEAQIPEEPPAASDRASVYETAPFGAVAPLADAEETSTGDDALATSPGDDPLTTSPGDDPLSTSSGDDVLATAPGDDALTADDPTPPAGAVDAPPLFEDPAGPIDGPPVGTLDSPPVDAPVPVLAADASEPPVTADTPESADSFDPSGSGASPALSPHAAEPEPDAIPKASKPSAAAPEAEEPGAAGGALERVKRDPKKVALAAVGAAVLFFIIRRLR